MSGFVVGKTKAERGGGEVTVDEVTKTGGELSGGEVVGDVVAKTGEEVGDGEEVVLSGSDREIGGMSSNS